MEPLFTEDESRSVTLTTDTPANVTIMVSAFEAAEVAAAEVAASVSGVIDPEIIAAGTDLSHRIIYDQKDIVALKASLDRSTWVDETHVTSPTKPEFLTYDRAIDHLPASAASDLIWGFVQTQGEEIKKLRADLDLLLERITDFNRRSGHKIQ